MKKTLLITLVFVMSATGLHAYQAGQFTVGARAGLGFGFNDPADFGQWLSPNVVFSDGSLPASVSDGNSSNFTFALYGNYAFTDNISLQLEISFLIAQGYDLRFSAPNQRSRLVDVNYTSLDIPILFRYRFTNFAAILGLQMGPHVSIPWRRVNIHEGYGYFATEIQEELSIDSAATFGFTAGAFAGFPIRPGNIVVDMRFIFDFNAVSAYEGGRTVDFMRRRVFALTVGYERSF